MAVYTKEPIDSFKSFLKQERLSDFRLEQNSKV